MTKLCSYCGKEIPQTSKICPYCNRPLMEDVLTYQVDEHKNKNISSTRKSTRDFSTNIYSVSNEELDRIFEKKLPDKPVTTPLQKTAKSISKSKSPSYKKGNKTNNTATIVLVSIIIILVVVLIVALLSSGASSLLSKTKDSSKQTITTQLTTQQNSSTTNTASTTSTSTTQKPTYSPSSTDLYGYLGVSFDTVNTHFGEQIKQSTVDEFYGGNTYYFDGLTITTVESGVIVSVTMDYSMCSNLDKYRFKELFFASTYDDVLAVMGTPDSDQLGSSAEPCISYVLDVGSGQSVKFFFDENNRLVKFDLFYAD